MRDVWLFFSKLNSIVNLVTTSPKHHSELQLTQAIEVAKKIVAGELETGRGLNQTCTLHQAGATH